MTTTSTVTAGPWQQQPEQRLPPEDRKAAIRATLILRRAISRTAETLEIARIVRRQLERAGPRIKASGDLTVLRGQRHFLAELTDDIKRHEDHIDVCAREMLRALVELQGELTDHEAGAVLGVHHVHIQRRGLLRASTKPPVNDAVADALLNQLIEQMMDNPIQHRQARQLLNRTLGTELPMPPRPKPEAV